ncbi:unnamed protein product [Fraxinus pennsylvanica]|uniref:UVR domain-containing protein n=1 Tax=Fraxinus pennsylvanica TaxID=56036 RepID=A0AAD2A7R4_9LAMI|nr:unnamed protein product [Fraxinus pennsylvanica]
MAGALVQSTGLPFSVTSARNGQWSTEKTKRTVTVLCNLQTTSLRMSSFSGLRTSNALDLLKQTGQTLQSKIAIVTSFNRGRKGRIAPRAMYERFTEKAIKVTITLDQSTCCWDYFVRVKVWQPVFLRIQVLILVIRMVGESVEAIGAGVGGGSSGNKMPTLEEYGTNLTKLAEEGKLNPVVGRQDQIERVTQILGRHTKNNPCLIGEPGVGKTAIAEGLALRIANGDVPKTIQGKKVIALDMGRLVAGTKYRGEFEERLKKLMEEIKQRDDIILFIDEVHTLIGAGAGPIDAANILKPALVWGELQCIGATTLDEYRKHIEKDPALERRFEPVKVREPTVDESVQILKGIRERYEIHHKLRYTDESLVAAAQLSHLYISDRFLPDKAIDLIDEAGYRVRLRHAQLQGEARELEKELRQITKEKNEAVISQDFQKAGELLDREMDLTAQISALIDKNKEMAKAESEAGDGGPVVTEVDIRHIVSSWTGIPVEKISTDESDRLHKTEEILHTRVIGQDEAVKAISRAIRRARVGLKNPNRPIASFIFSGPEELGYIRIKSLVKEELKQYFRPEFLNRLDDVIVFRQLTKLAVKDIAYIMLKEVLERLKAKDTELQVTERFRDRVVEEGYNPSYRARPLRRAIMRLLEVSMAEKILASEIKEGDSVIVNKIVLNGSSGTSPKPIPLKIEPYLTYTDLSFFILIYFLVIS